MNWFIAALCVLVFGVSIFFITKNEVTYKHHNMLDKAILRYKLECICNQTKYLVDHDDMENYAITLHRFWDWGYTRILPKEKFEIIKAYI